MKEKRKLLIIGILATIVIALSGIVFYYWYENTYYVSTDDARVSADLVSVTPQITGKLLELNVSEGDTVSKNEILARQDVNGLADTNVEQSLMRSPIDGVVVKKQGTVGEFISAGQSVITLIDPNKLYVTADIEETKLGKVKVGQPVEITIDQYDSQKFTGKVKSITAYAAGTNLFILSNFRLIDPESSRFGSSGLGNIAQGFSNGEYPNARVFTFGLNATF